MIYIVALENRYKHRFVEMFSKKSEKTKFLKNKSPAQRIIADIEFPTPSSSREHLEQMKKIAELIEYTQ